MNVAQLVERSLPTPEVRSSNQVIGTFYITYLRLIHTRCRRLHIPLWAATTQRYEIFYLPAETQPSATDAHGKHSNVNEPLLSTVLKRRKQEAGIF